MTKVLCIGEAKVEGAEQQLWVSPSETETQRLRCLTSGQKTVRHPLLPSLTQLSHWPPVFYSWTPYSTVLYLGHCVSFFLEYIMLQNAPLSYFLKWLATEAEKPAKSYFLQRACQHSNLRMRKSFKGDDDTDYDEFLDFLESDLLKQTLSQ